MHVIILAAGQSKRFQEEGYMVPKPFLEIEWHGSTRTMLEHVIRTVPVGFLPNVISAIPGGREFIGNHLTVPKTKGPADTALRMIKAIEPSSCLLLDSDVLNFTNDLYRITRTDVSGVLVSHSANPSFSYVNGLGTFITINEKRRISEYAVRGAYFVSSKAMTEFISCLEQIVATEQEPYISHAFSLMKCKKSAMLTSYRPIEWGTPRDVFLSGARIVTPKEG